MSKRKKVLLDLVDAAKWGRAFLREDRKALCDCHTGPDGLDPEVSYEIAQYDAALRALTAAIRAAEEK